MLSVALEGAYASKSIHTNQVFSSAFSFWYTLQILLNIMKVCFETVYMLKTHVLVS